MMDPLHLSLFATIGPTIPGPLVWLGAWLGHGFLWVVVLNVTYSYPIHHRILDILRTFVILLGLSGPILFLESFRFPNDVGLNTSSSALGSLWSAYTMLCFVLGFVVAPLCQLNYWLRRRPVQMLRRDSEIVDIARKLGYRPRGRGKQAALALVPGNQIFQVEFADVHLRLPQLPQAWDGLTILHLTDLHFHKGMDRKFFQAVIDRCLEWGTPDLVCITGDIVDSAWHHRWIMPTLGRLRWKDAGLFLLGNHDSWWDTKTIRRRFVRLGMQDAGNRRLQLEIRGKPLIVIGNEGPWIGPVPPMEPSTAETFCLCLSHSPDRIGWARRHRADLMLAGHVHGGQIRLPLIGSIFVPSFHSRKYDRGTFFEAPTLMYVGRGLSSNYMVRLNCRPEVTRLVLRSGQ